MLSKKSLMFKVKCTECLEWSENSEYSEDSDYFDCFDSYHIVLVSFVNTGTNILFFLLLFSGKVYLCYTKFEIK